MLKLGEYCEEDARIITGYLKDAGFKVDARGLVRSVLNFSSTLEGKLSEIDGKAKSFDKYRGYVEALKTIYAKGVDPDDLSDLFLNEVCPGWKEKVERLKTLRDSQDTRLSDLPEEERNILLENVTECYIVSKFMNDFLEINDIDLENPDSSIPDDPKIIIPVNADDYGDDENLLQMRLDVEMDKVVVVSVDEFSTTHYEKLSNEFIDEFGAEFLKIRAMGIMIADIVECAEKGKMDFEDFADLCELEIGKKNIMTVDATLVAEEIARSLEKMGLLKIKGDIIKWKL